MDHSDRRSAEGLLQGLRSRLGLRELVHVIVVFIVLDPRDDPEHALSARDGGLDLPDDLREIATGASEVATGFRPAGRSRSTVVASSPRSASASVRGIGVALRERRCGRSPFCTSARRWPTPRRRRSSTTTSRELRERDPLPEQRVRADCDARLGAREHALGAPSLGHRHPGGDERDARTGRSLERTHRGEVLLREDAGRRRGSPPGVPRPRTGRSRRARPRLPRSHVAEHEAAHRPRTSEIARDVGACAALIVLHREAERVLEPRHDVWHGEEARAQAQRRALPPRGAAPTRA